VEPDHSDFVILSIGVYSWLMRILVTGGAGFIGSHLVEKLLAAGHEVAILDDFNDFYDPQIKRDNIAAVSKDTAIHHVDLRDSAAVRNVFHREKFETIVHVAARAGVRPSIQYPQLYYDTNVSGTLHLLDAARVTGVERFIFASSSSVYGISKTVPFSEDQHLTQTLSPYAATKIAGEFLCSTFSHLIKCAWSRCVISPFMAHGNGPIWRSIGSPDAFTPASRSINSATARPGATTLT